MGIMWHCEPNMMRDIVAKCKKYAGDIMKLIKFKG